MSIETRTTMFPEIINRFHPAIQGNDQSAEMASRDGFPSGVPRNLEFNATVRYSPKVFDEKEDIIFRIEEVRVKFAYKFHGRI